MKRMDYFSAVQEGRRRVDKAVALLQDVAGPCYPMLFLKMGLDEWVPVGDEMLQKAIPGKDEKEAIVICDSDGNSKAMSSWLTRTKASECSNILEARGVATFPGEVKLPI